MKKNNNLRILILLFLSGSFLMSCGGGGGGGSDTTASQPKAWSLTSNPSGSNAEPFSIVAHAGYLYVAGYNETTGEICGDPQCSQWRIEKREMSDGSLVPAFGSGGIVSPASTSDNDAIYSIVIAGTSLYAVGIDQDLGWRIEKRNLLNGELDKTFGTVYSQPTLSSDTAIAVVEHEGFIYIVGYSSDEFFDHEIWKIEKRDASTGALDPGFGDAGVVTSGTGTGQNEALTAATDGTFLYIAGFDSSAGNAQWRIEKRSLSNGTLDEGFRSGGILTLNPSVNDDMATTIAVSEGNLYIAGYDSFPGSTNNRWRIEKISALTGVPDPSFDTVLSNPGLGYDAPQSIVLDQAAGALYIAGYDSNTGDLRWQWRIEKRSMADGQLESGFGTNGVVSIDPAVNEHDGANAIALDPTQPYIYVAGYDSVPGNWQWRMEKIAK